jgi:hypothetical protein
MNSQMRRLRMVLVLPIPVVWLCGCAMVASMVGSLVVGGTVELTKAILRPAKAQSQCHADLQARELDAIRDKVELVVSPELPPPLVITSNDSFPTEDERPAIARWAAIRDECAKRTNTDSNAPLSEGDSVAAYEQQHEAFVREVEARVSELVLALYESKLTYGEFAQKRFELTKASVAAQRDFMDAQVDLNPSRQSRAKQLAKQEFENNLLAWSAYVQEVNARQPRAVRLNCATRQPGSISRTTCD